MGRELKIATGIAVVALLVLIGAVFAIGYKSGDNKQPEAKSTYSNSVDQNKDTRFNAAWNDVGGSMSADRARDYAKQVCQRLRNGDPVNKIANDLIDVAGPNDAGFILGGAVGVYCPLFEKQVVNGMDNLTRTS